MSSDGYGLDKAARLEAQQQDEQAAVPELEPEFPFTVVAFDPAFFGVSSSARIEGTGPL